MRVPTLDLNESWAFEVDFEYSSGILLHIETRLEVQAPELEKDILKTNIKEDSNGDVSSEFLDSIEQYGNQFRHSEALDSAAKVNDEAGLSNFFHVFSSFAYLLLESSFAMSINDSINIM